MPSYLIRNPGNRAEQRYLLEPGELIIGRDPAADIFLDEERVSRRHAVVETRGRQTSIEDLGSANGTLVNGELLAGKQRLSPADRILVAGDVELVFEQVGAAVDRSRAPKLAVTFLVILLAFVSSIWWWPESTDLVLEQAAALASDGLAAWREGNKVKTKESLKSAAGILFRNGYLDDVPRRQVMEAALLRLGDQIGTEEDLAEIFRQSLEKEQVVEKRGSDCRLPDAAPEELSVCLNRWVRVVMLELRQDPESVPDPFVAEVGKRMRVEHSFLANAFERGRPIVPMLRKELEEAKMPPLLHYLALIESGYRKDVRSHAGAVGLWQFMPATGKRYGLKVRGKADDRTDPVRSTKAASRYLRDLAFEFGGDALLLALAGYNRGENGVRRALKRLDDPFSDRSYWRLVERELLPEETAKYVPRFIAAAVAGEGGLPSRSALEKAGY